MMWKQTPVTEVYDKYFLMKKLIIAKDTPNVT